MPPKHLSTYKLRRALAIVQENPAPDRFSLDPKDLKGKDYASLHIELDSQTGTRFRFERINGDTLYGKTNTDPDGPTDKQHALEINKAAVLPLKFRNWRDGLEFNSQSPEEFLRDRASWYFYLCKALIWLKRKRESTRSISTRDREDVLKYLVDREFKTQKDELMFPDNGLDAFRYAWERFGVGFFGHPNHESELKKVKIILRSLAESGELFERNGRFEISPNALTTIHNWDNENRRHRDSMFIQRTVAVLTIIIAFGTIYPIVESWLQ